ncbi:hypothetical protein PIROE2DRAFT_1455 [Piromyces sp. E2]|nr:hypothetical protein PIROE2DRAFT_1455 [Piromyces sp. E2]|eukprot:OUM70323.1 hypothetical protein PIROE2DRAFT_1455 [Piromyces sp. E2]
MKLSSIIISICNSMLVFGNKTPNINYSDLSSIDNYSIEDLPTITLGDYKILQEGFNEIENYLLDYINSQNNTLKHRSRTPGDDLKITAKYALQCANWPPLWAACTVECMTGNK